MFRAIFSLGLLLIIASSCNDQASSRFEVVRLENDQISDREKISLFEESSEALSGPAYAAIAKLYANEGDYNAALNTVHEAILQDPMNSFYHTLKSSYAFESGDVGTAYREALTAYQLGSKSLQQSLMLAKMGVALSEYNIVDNIIDSLLIVYPNNPEVVFMAARKFEKSGKAGQAIDQYQKGIELNPSRTDNYFYLANLYRSLNNEVSALKTLENFIGPNLEPGMIMIKAEAFEQAGNVDSATTYYSYLVADKKDSLIYDRFISMYRRHEMREPLLEITQRAADSFPESKHFVRNAGEVMDSRYKYNEALVYYQQLFELDTLDTMVAEEVSILQRKIAYLQRKKEEERIENAIPIRRVTLPFLDSLNKY